ncbi:armadillo-repeat protein [Vairimorpha necatrix]|uniref:Armadillo-repeat protein n=1 Tax=Vairimorpha necatrix TaxID=6039 RepID=A0AAX4JDY8_9MICR
MSSILNCINEVALLVNKKEDEVTWSKIDKIFSILKDDLSTKEDCKIFLNKSMDLLLRSILSERSKLSGTSLNLLKKIFDILKEEVGNIQNILSILFRLSGRSNKIVYSRAHDAIQHISEYINLSEYYKVLTEYYESNNKNIRLGVIKAIEKDQSKEERPDKNKNILQIEKIIEKGKNDLFLEIRNICKNMKKETEISKNPIENIQEIIKSPIRHSPFKKIPKMEESPSYNKIIELGRQVKTITKEKKIEKKVKPIIFKSEVKFIKKKKEIQDELTPKKLDKYLNKYRNLYGNILEEKEEEIEMSDLSKEIENLSLVEENKLEELNYEYTIMNSDKTKTKLEEDLKIEDIENEIVEEEIDRDVLEIVEDEIERDVLEAVEEEKVDKHAMNEHEAVENGMKEHEAEIQIQEKEIKVKKSEINQNRFSSLLFADKDECVIYDINVESPIFKKEESKNQEPPTEKNELKDSVDSTPKNCPNSTLKTVVNTAVSSSFLYSNENSVDYTKIDSVIEVDKNLFNMKKN